MTIQNPLQFKHTKKNSHIRHSTLNKKAILQTLTIFIVLVSPSFTLTTQKGPPLVGMFMQPFLPFTQKIYNFSDQTMNYMFRNYEKWVASTGAIPVILPFDLEPELMTKILKHLDFLIIPGGNIKRFNLQNEASPYQKFIYSIYDTVIQRNEVEGDYLGVFAICQGFQQYANYFGNSTSNVNCKYDAQMAQFSLIKGRDFEKSEFWSKTLKRELTDYIFEEEEVVFFNSCGISLPDFERDLSHTTRMVASAKDRAGLEFVAAIEHKTLPILATQFHPEHLNYPKTLEYGVVRKSKKAVRLMRDIIFEALKDARQHAKPINTIPDYVKEYFSIYSPSSKRIDHRTPQAYVRWRTNPDDESWYY